MDEVIQISRDELYHSVVDSTLAHQKALVRQAAPIVEQPVSKWRRVFLSNLFYTPLAGFLGALTTWLILEPFLDENSDGSGSSAAFILLFPMLCSLIVLFIFISEGISSRRIRGNSRRWIGGVGLTLLFSFVALFPAGILVLVLRALPSFPDESIVGDITKWSAVFFYGFIAWRSLAWTVFGFTLGLAMNLIRSTPAQRRASMMGGAIGGALGGLLFDPINRFLFPSAVDGDVFRLVGFCFIGLSLGFFVALSERLGREGWVRVRTGPLRGKAFILYHNPTIIGSSPKSTIYLFKDPKIAPEHAALHRVGGGYELADIRSSGDAAPTTIDGEPITRRRLVSGDQITIGDTILDFEERAKKRNIQSVVKEAGA